MESHHSPASSSPKTRVSSNLVHSILRNKNDKPAIGPLQPAASADGAMLQGIARRISLETGSTRDLLLTTGFGLHRSLAVPVRLPALILPGLRIMERLQDAGEPVPEYVVYQATDFVAETNQLSPIDAQACALRMETYLREYVRAFHARIMDRVQLRFGEPYGTIERERISDGVLRIREDLSALPGIGEALRSLRTSEGRHSNGSDQATMYAAANAYYSGALTAYPHDAMGRIVLPIGGQAEKPFFAITSACADASKARSVIPMVTMLGSRPTYFHYPESGDLIDPAAFPAGPSSHRDGPIRKDLQAMQADGATREILETIYPRAS